MAKMNGYEKFYKNDLAIGGNPRLDERPSAISDSMDTQPTIQQLKKFTKEDFKKMMQVEREEI
jgi:hypothetical protein